MIKRIITIATINMNRYKIRPMSHPHASMTRFRKLYFESWLSVSGAGKLGLFLTRNGRNFNAQLSESISLGRKLLQQRQQRGQILLDQLARILRLQLYRDGRNMFVNSGQKAKRAGRVVAERGTERIAVNRS